ncbi:hypothetical protein LINPERHAP2_LOCUS32718 [Linum perenne]
MDGDAGSWMTASRHNKKHPPKKASTSDNAVDTGSRFVVLTTSAESPDEVEVEVVEPAKAPKTVPSSLEADALKAILDKALASDNASKGKVQVQPDALPLKDVTNKALGKNGNKKLGKGAGGKQNLKDGTIEGLISIPVAYHNPIFQIIPDQPNSHSAVPAHNASQLKTKPSSSKPRAVKNAKKVDVPVKKPMAKTTKKVRGSGEFVSLIRAGPC